MINEHLILITLALTTLLFVITFFATWRTRNMELVTNVVFIYFSFSIGFVNYAFFRWYFYQPIFVHKLEQPFYLWALGSFIYLIGILFYILPKIPKQTPTFSSVGIKKRLTFFIGSLVAVLFCIIAFVKSGTIPLFSKIVDEGRSAMSASGFLYNFYFIISFCTTNLFINFIHNRKKMEFFKFLELGLSMVCFLLLILLSVRNFILIAFLTSLFYYIRVKNIRINLVKTTLLGIVMLVFLQFFGQMRSGQDQTTDVRLLTSRLLSGTFSEFREWPDIMLKKEIPNASPIKGALHGVVPSSVHSVFGLDKDNLLFQSGMFYRHLLNRAWIGDNLGLRTSLYGDFYLSFGVWGFVLLPIILLIIVKRLIQRSSSLDSEQALLSNFLILTLTIAFSSELSTLIQKVYTLILFYIFIQGLRLLFSFLFPKLE